LGRKTSEKERKKPIGRKRLYLPGGKKRFPGEGNRVTGLFKKETEKPPGRRGELDTQHAKSDDPIGNHKKGASVGGQSELKVEHV